MTTSASIAIVILNWNGRRYLEQFLPSVMATTYANKTVVVVDNCSTDDSIPFLQQQYPAVRIVALNQNFGFSKGYNEGLKQVQADYYVLLNSDVEVTPGWIDPVLQLMENDRSIAVCMPKILQFHNRQFFEYAGACGGWIDFMGYPFARGRIFDICEEDHGQYDDTVPVFWAGGCAMFVRSEVYHGLGGLDEYFFAHQEEIDFCWRIHLAGYKVYVCPQSVVYHVGGGTLPKGNARKVFLNFRNNLIMMAKNMPAGQAVVKVVLRIFLDIVSAVKSLMEGQFTYFTAVGKAHLAFFRWLILGRKRTPSNLNKRAPLQGYWHKMVVWSHFAKGKKTFAEIVGPKS